jgi:hypothetical protein
MIIDCHVHSRGTEKTDDILRAMDQAQIDRICLFSPYAAATELGGTGPYGADEAGMRGPWNGSAR